MNTDEQAVKRRLEELEALETVSPFARAFYRLIFRWGWRKTENEALRIAVAALLDVEWRYHYELNKLIHSDELELGDLQAIGERHRVGLNAVRQYAQRVEAGEPAAAAVQALVLAESNYLLGRRAEVVASLERAVELGVKDPLVYFALGYNRYLLAVETCTEPAEDSELYLHDASAFRQQCLQAVSALEAGLQGSELDGQLYWWMGVILESAGLTEAAQNAYDNFEQIAAGFAGNKKASRRLRRSLRREQREKSPLGAITEEEIRRAADLLQHPFNPRWLKERPSSEGGANS